MVWWTIWIRNIFQAVLCTIQLFQWKLICTFNQLLSKLQSFQQTSIQLFSVSPQIVQNDVALTHYFQHDCATRWKHVLIHKYVCICFLLVSIKGKLSCFSIKLRVHMYLPSWQKTNFFGIISILSPKSMSKLINVNCLVAKITQTSL